MERWRLIGWEGTEEEDGELIGVTSDPETVEQWRMVFAAELENALMEIQDWSIPGT